MDIVQLHNAITYARAAKQWLLDSMTYHNSESLEQSLRSLNAHMEHLRYLIETEQLKAKGK